MTEEKKGLFIVFTGIDGSGKTTQIFKTANYLFQKKKEKDIFLTREPYNSEHGKKLREGILKENDPLKNAHECLQLYVLDRKHHVENVIKPKLKEGSIIICDRYYYDTIVYQNLQGLQAEEIAEKNMEFPVPDIVFVVDVPAEVAHERITKRGEDRTKFEQLAFMQNVREKFLSLPEEIKLMDVKRGEIYRNVKIENIKVINGNQLEEEVFAEIQKEMDLLISQ